MFFLRPFWHYILICRCDEHHRKKIRNKNPLPLRCCSQRYISCCAAKPAAHELRTGGITWFSYSYLFSAVHLHFGISEWLNGLLLQHCWTIIRNENPLPLRWCSQRYISSCAAKTAAHELRTGGITWFSYSYDCSTAHIRFVSHLTILSVCR